MHTMKFQYMLLSLIDYTKFIDIISLIMVGVIGGVYGIMKFVKSRIKTDNFIEIHTEIHELLTELRVTTKCMRASIIQFHNGEYYANGISMRKMSISHESVHRGYNSQVNKLKNVLCSLCIPLLNQVLQDNPLIHNTSVLQDGYFKEFLEDENISKYSCLLIKDKGINTGFILLQWHKDYIPVSHELDNNNKIFEDFTAAISLNLQYNKNYK